jgi:hypothetical protein
MIMMKNVMDEYLEILDIYIGEQNGTLYINHPEELLLVIDSFWMNNFQEMLDYLKEPTNSLRTYHEFFGQDVTKDVSRISLFSDEIIISDHFVTASRQLRPNFELRNADRFRYAFSFIKNIYELREWINEGIVIVVPSSPSTDFATCEHNGIKTRLSYDEILRQDIKEIGLTEEEYWDIVLNPKRAYLNEKDWNFNNLNTKQLLQAYSLNGVNGFLFSSELYQSSPCTNDINFWKALMDKIERDARVLDSNSLYASTLINTKANFLNDVPIEFAKKMRDEGYLSELRIFFREKFNQIKTTPDKDDFYEIISSLSSEINDEVVHYEHEWKSMKNEMIKNVTVKSSIGIVSGVLTAAPTYGLSIPGWLALLGTCLSAGSAIDEILKYINRRNKRHLNGINLLVDLKNFSKY